MDDEYIFKSNIPQRYSASQQRNVLDEGERYRARRTLNGIVHCKHGLDPCCPCVQRFAVDKSSPLTEQQAKVGAASFIRSEIEKLKTWDSRYVPLTKIIKCSENERDFHIREYESTYGPLLSKDILEIDDSVGHLRNLMPIPQQKAVSAIPAGLKM
jgi:hypothetical protein